MEDGGVVAGFVDELAKLAVNPTQGLRPPKSRVLDKPTITARKMRGAIDIPRPAPMTTRGQFGTGVGSATGDFGTGQAKSSLKEVVSMDKQAGVQEDIQGYLSAARKSIGGAYETGKEYAGQALQAGKEMAGQGAEWWSGVVDQYRPGMAQLYQSVLNMPSAGTAVGAGSGLRQEFSAPAMAAQASLKSFKITF